MSVVRCEELKRGGKGNCLVPPSPSPDRLSKIEGLDLSESAVCLLEINRKC
jgi:hypothetical protein